MNTYYIAVKVVTESRQLIEVEANSESEAGSKVKDLINGTFYTYIEQGEDKTIEITHVRKLD